MNHCQPPRAMRRHPHHLQAIRTSGLQQVSRLWLLISLCVVASAGCNRAVDPAYANADFAVAFKTHAKMAPHTIAMSALNGARRSAIVCVLGPYNESIDPEYNYAAQLNSLIEQARYLGNEDRWGVVQFSPASKLEISLVYQNTAEYFAPAKHATAAFCNPVNDTVIVFHPDGRAEFRTR